MTQTACHGTPPLLTTILKHSKQVRNHYIDTLPTRPIHGRPPPARTTPSAVLSWVARGYVTFVDVAFSLAGSRLDTDTVYSDHGDVTKNGCKQERENGIITIIMMMMMMIMIIIIIISWKLHLARQALQPSWRHLTSMLDSHHRVNSS